jgi:hypothetical protein
MELLYGFGVLNTIVTAKGPITRRHDWTILDCSIHKRAKFGGGPAVTKIPTAALTCMARLFGKEVLKVDI